MTTVPGVAPQTAAEGPLKAAALTYYTTVKAAGRQPDANMVIGWDSATIVVAALRKLGPDASPEALRAYIAGLHGFYGAAGQYDFRDGSQHGLTGNTAVVVRYESAQHVFVPVSRIGGAATAP
jgi:branched-chain amino acid transport system substrate-binding protein